MLDQKQANINEIWSEVLSKLSKKLKKPSFETWIKPLRLNSIKDNYAIIATKNEFSRNFISQSFLEDIQIAIKEVLATSLGIRLVIDSTISIHEENKDSSNEIEAKQVSFADISTPDQNLSLTKAKTNLNKDYTFDNYVLGSFNKVSFALSQAFAQKSNSYKSLYISSETGLGKTHLLNAIGNTAHSNDRALNLKYISAEQFTNELVKSIRSNNSQEFKSKYRDLDMLLMDDFQFFEGKTVSQEEFLYTYNSIVNKGGQVVISSNKPLNALSKFESALSSRLEGSLVAEIDQPDFDSRLCILEEKASEENIKVKSSVLDALANIYTNNIRELEGSLLRLSAYTSFTDEDIDDHLVSKLFGASRHGGQYHGLSIEDISKTVAKYFGISLDDIRGPRRVLDFAKARHIAIFLAYDMLELSYSRIGEYFSGRKHSSVIHSIKTIKNDLIRDRSIALIVNDIKSKL